MNQRRLFPAPLFDAYFHVQKYKSLHHFQTSQIELIPKEKIFPSPLISGQPQLAAVLLNSLDSAETSRTAIVAVVAVASRLGASRCRTAVHRAGSFGRVGLRQWSLLAVVPNTKVCEPGADCIAEIQAAGVGWVCSKNLVVVAAGDAASGLVRRCSGAGGWWTGTTAVRLRQT